MEKLYYLDNAATTKCFEEEFDLMKNNNETSFYNPSAAYLFGRNSKKILDECRIKINNALHGINGKLYFTSSATESSNTVFEGVHLRKGQVVLVSMAEHPAVYNAAHRLEKDGIIVKDIPLGIDGMVDFEQYKNLITNDVALISIIHVSNETGAINDIKMLCEYAKKINKSIIFHSDGVQAFGKIKVNLLDLGVDLYSISAHKIYAPRGIAGLWVKKGVNIDAFLVGGGQEDGFRSSTENVAGAVAFAYAVEKVISELKINYSIVENYKKIFLDKLLNSQIGGFLKVNSTNNCSPYVVSLSFNGIKGEVLMSALESDGILVSTGSACSSKKAGNRTLEAMGIDSKDIIGSVRVSFSSYIKYDFDYICDMFVKNVLRFEKNNFTKK